MSSGSFSIGDARDQATALVANARRTVPSLHVQASPSDAFADVFRLIANTSPAADRPSSRHRSPRAEAEKDDELQKAEKSQPSASDDVRDSRQTEENRPPDAALPGSALMVPKAEQSLAAEIGVEGDLQTDERETNPQDGLLREEEIVAGTQHQMVITADSPEGQPIVTETMPEAAQLVRDQANAHESKPTGETVAIKPEAIETPATPAEKAIVRPAVTEEVPPDGKVASHRDAVVGQPIDDVSGDPALPKPSSETVVADADESLEASVDELANEVSEESGKPLFGGRDEEQSNSRRRHESDPRRSSTTPDANRVPLDPSSAEMRGAQVEMVSTETDVDATNPDQAVRDWTARIDTPQSHSNSVSQPVVAAAAAYGSATSEAASPKTFAKSTPQVGVASAPPGATENGQRPASNEPSGPGIADRIRLVQRVANAFQRLGMDGGQVRIRLHPAELGSVRLDLQIQGKRLNARVTAETEAARGVLREHLPDLRQRLVEQGIQVERIDVELETETHEQRDSSHHEGPAGRFGQPQRRESRADSFSPEHDLNGSSNGVETRRNPVGRSVADAVSRPGVDLVF